MDRGLAVELRSDGLLGEIFALENAAQYRLDDGVAALVGGNVGQAHLVVELLLRHVVRADMRDNLSDGGLSLFLLPAATRQSDDAGQRENKRRATRIAQVTCKTTQQNLSPGWSAVTPRPRASRLRYKALSALLRTVYSADRA